MSVDGDMETGAPMVDRQVYAPLVGSLVIANVTEELISCCGGMDRWGVTFITPSLVSWGPRLSTVDPSCPEEQFSPRVSAGQNRGSVCS